ncbi:MAG: hypothetical protein FWD17_09415 [Polyangiaceae bacterium]|nr:hypothetical protein [Polyangiaceae bacterium]
MLQPAAAPAPTATAPYGYQTYPPPQGAYPQQYPAATVPTYSQYPQQPAPQPAPAPVPAPAPPPAPAPAPAPAASGQMAMPGPVAFQCQNDVPCGTHHCNVQYGKCAFPCQTNVDCISPNSCVMGLCVPAPPSAQPTH